MVLVATGLVALTALAVDQNSNGVSDIYERLHSLDAAMLDVDLDGDGFTCRQEAAFGTDPRSAASLPCAVVVNASGGLELQWQSVIGIRYQVQSSTDLTGWVAVGDAVTGTGAEMSVPCAITETRRFFRVAALPSADQDSDGLTAYEEGLYGSSDNSADSDSDGLTDSNESELGTNPTLGDSDGDGIGDGDEASQGGDPTDPADGLPQNPEKRPVVVRMTYYAGWPNYPISVPPIPALDFTIRDVALGSIVGHVTQAAAFTGDARPLGFFSGYTSSGGTPDPTITRGREYELKMNYARGTGLWKSGANGRIFSPTSLNPVGETINLLIYSTRFDGGSFWVSNNDGGVWLESTWLATGTPTNSVANSRQFYVHDTLCPTARMWAVDFDLDLDSDNNNLTALPDQSLAEDDIEAIQPKFVVRNSNDDDADGVVDSVDLDNEHEQDFVPLVLDVAPASLPYDKITIKFRYSGAASYAADQTGDLRLWRVNNPKMPRTAAEYIQPDRAYAAADLGLDSHNPHVKLMIEALTEVPEPSDIEAAFLFNGVEYFTDKVGVWGGAIVALAVDADRDGQIKLPAEDASDATSKGKPFRFWLNDDIDRVHSFKDSAGGTMADIMETEEDDIGSVESQQDRLSADMWTDNKADSLRDLEDFNRIWLSTQGLNAAFKNGDLHLGLKWTDVSAGNPGIRVYEQHDTTGGLSYLTDETEATAQIGVYAVRDARYQSDSPGLSIKTIVRGTDVFVLPTSLFANLTESSPKTCFLFEGLEAGKGQLKLVILKKDGTTYTEIGEGPGVWMELKTIGDMYEHWSVGNGSGGEPLSAASRVAAEKGSSTVYSYDASSPEERKYILLVHGWNMEKWEKERYAETAYKRLYWQGYKGRFGLFSWPCTNKFDETQPAWKLWEGVTDGTNFDRGEWTAWRSGAPLRQLMQTLSATYGGDLYVFSHSMGGIVVSEALRLQSQTGGAQIAKVYVASQAALSAHLYDGSLSTNFDANDPLNTALQFDYEHPLKEGVQHYGPQTPNTIYPNWFAYLRAGGAGGTSAVNRVVNFYNANDWALAAPVWGFNQITKPDWRDILSHQLYTYEYDSLITEFCRINILNGRTFLEPGTRAAPLDRYEIMAFAAESQVKAFGATATISQGITGMVNLQSVWGSDPEGGDHKAHTWHSGQFRSTIHRQRNYWKTLLSRQGFDITTSATLP